MDIFIAVLLVLLVMMYFMFVTLKASVENVNHKVNQFFIDKLQDFDEDFKEKIDEMEGLTEEKEQLQREVRAMKNDMISFKTSPFYAPRPLARSVYIPVARYIDNDFFEEYKSAKDMLKMDKPQIILDIIDKVPYVGNRDLYNVANSILEKLNFDALFEMSSLKSSEQLEILDESLDKKEQKFLVDYLVNELSDPEDFQCLDFISHVKKIINENDPHIFVKTGEIDEDLSYVHKYVINQYDDNICEGIKLIYQNKVYDYSIYKSRKRVDKD